jgi:pimeloyl-ACP methyl ester carboxylesterase
VLCYPFGLEYLRAHRSFRQLAVLLVRNGFDVLRFDYWGSGDSGGESHQATLTHWSEDLQHAVRELRVRAGVREVSLVGLRLGATLVCSAARSLAPVADLVLWDPVPAGTDYVEGLKRRHLNWLSQAMQELPVELQAYQRAAAAAESQNGSGPFEVVGFPVTHALRREIEGVDLMSTPAPPARRILLLDTTSENSSGSNLCEHLSSAGAECTQLHHPARPVWLGAAGATVPGDLLRRIVCWTSETSS